VTRLLSAYLAEHGILPLVAEALAMASVFALLAGLWIVAP
jgi:hypothetical protein